MSSKLPGISKGLLAFTGAYLAVAVVALLVQQNWEFAMYLVIMGVLIAGLFVVHKNVGLSSGSLWCLSVWGLMHMAGGLVSIPAEWAQEGSQPVLYSMWLIPDSLKYDQVVHAFGFGVTTWVCWQVLRNNVLAQTGQVPKATFGLCLLSAACGMGFGALNEVIEFVATLLIPETNVGGYINTGWDLVANLTGCTVAAVWIYCSNAKS